MNGGTHCKYNCDKTIRNWIVFGTIYLNSNFHTIFTTLHKKWAKSVFGVSSWRSLDKPASPVGCISAFSYPSIYNEDFVLFEMLWSLQSSSAVFMSWIASDHEPRGHSLSLPLPAILLTAFVHFLWRLRFFHKLVFVPKSDIQIVVADLTLEERTCLNLLFSSCMLGDLGLARWSPPLLFSPFAPPNARITWWTENKICCQGLKYDCALGIWLDSGIQYIKCRTSTLYIY